jgi:hypothetical protein
LLVVVLFFFALETKETLEEVIEDYGATIAKLSGCTDIISCGF